MPVKKKSVSKKTIVKVKKLPKVEPTELEVRDLYRYFNEEYKYWFFRYNIYVSGKLHSNHEIIDTSNYWDPKKEFSKRTYIVTGIAIGGLLTLLAQYIERML